MMAARRECHAHVPFPPPLLLLSARPGLRKKNISDGSSIDPEKNIALFNVIKKARAGGVPKANIESALQRVRTKYIYIQYTKKIN